MRSVWHVSRIRFLRKCDKSLSKWTPLHSLSHDNIHNMPLKKNTVTQTITIALYTSKNLMFHKFTPSSTLNIFSYQHFSFHHNLNHCAPNYNHQKAIFNTTSTIFSKIVQRQFTTDNSFITTIVRKNPKNSAPQQPHCIITQHLNTPHQPTYWWLKTRSSWTSYLLFVHNNHNTPSS